MSTFITEHYPASFFHPQIFLNYLGNYVPNMWNYEHGCILCDKDILDLSQLNVSPLNGLILISFALRPPDARLQCGLFLTCLSMGTGKDETLQ